jgi:[ribosomal protein S5]-alanine N-acetyltransferase
MFHLTPVVLTTPRLRLRWMENADAEAQYAIFSDPEVVRFWSSAPWTTLEQSTDAIARALAGYSDGSSLRFAVELQQTPGLIGCITLFRLDEQSRRCEIGYALARAHWGHGYATEAVHAALEYGFEALGLNRVEADIDPRNAASARTLERLGFRQEGFMPERWFVHGEMADTVYYGLLKRYWNESRPVPPFVRA